MAKVTKEHEFKSIIQLLEKEARNKGEFLTQEEVYKILDRKKILVSEEGADELLGQLIKEHIIEDRADDEDQNTVSEKDLHDEFPSASDGTLSNLLLKDYDDTDEIDLSNITTRKVVSDLDIQNKLTETDDIVK